MAANKIDRDVESPFCEIDEVSDEIFEKVISFPQPDKSEGPVEDQLENPVSGYHKVTGFLSHAIPRIEDFGFFRSDDDPRQVNEQNALDGKSHGLCLGKDVSQDYSSRRQTKKGKPGGLNTYLSLPDDVGMLESVPLALDEETTMTAIRSVMVEQRREYSRSILPALSPVGMSDQTDILELGELDATDGSKGSVCQSLSIGFVRFMKAPRARRMVPWFVLCLPIFVINQQLFTVLLSVSICSLIVLSLLSAVYLIFGRLVVGIASVVELVRKAAVLR